MSSDAFFFDLATAFTLGVFCAVLVVALAALAVVLTERHADRRATRLSEPQGWRDRLDEWSAMRRD